MESKGHRKCIVCQTTENNENISYHRFPKDVDRRIKWIKVLKIHVRDATFSSYVCSNHFNATDFIRIGPRKYLKADALPRPYIEPSFSTQSITLMERKMLESSEIELTEPKIEIKEEILEDRETVQKEYSSDTSTSSEAEEQMRNNVRFMDLYPISVVPLGRLVTLDQVSAGISVASLSGLNSGVVEMPTERSLPERAKKRRLNLKRYFGDFRKEDLEDPSLRQQFWYQAQKTVASQKRHIRTMNKKIRRMRNRIHSLKPPGKIKS